MKPAEMLPDPATGEHDDPPAEAGTGGDDLDGLEDPIDGEEDGEPTSGASRRIQQLVEERNSEREARQRAEDNVSRLIARLESLAGNGEPEGGGRRPAPEQRGPDLKDLPNAPDGMNALEAAYFHIDKGLGRYLERHLRGLGIDLDALRQHSSQLGSLASSTIRREWSDLCREHGVDPRNRIVGSAFQHLIAQGKTPADAMAEIAKDLPKKPERRTATPITSGSTFTPTVEKVVVRDKRHAGELARKGKVAPDIGIFDALAQRERLRRDRGSGG